MLMMLLAMLYLVVVAEALLVPPAPSLYARRQSNLHNRQHQHLRNPLKAVQLHATRSRSIPPSTSTTATATTSNKQRTRQRQPSRKETIESVIASMGLTQVISQKKKKKQKLKPKKDDTKKEGGNANNSKAKAPSNVPTTKPEQQQQLETSTSVDKLGDTSAADWGWGGEHMNEDNSRGSKGSPRPDVSIQTQLDYARNGHAALRGLLDPDIVREVSDDIRALVARQAQINHGKKKNSKRKGNSQVPVEDGAPFLQLFNTWRELPSVRRLAASPPLCRAACALLDLPPSSRLRLLQDAVFVKRPGRHGITPWHLDGRMLPLDTSALLTVWIPLQDVPALERGGTGLLFLHGSHADFALPYWNGRGRDEGEDGGAGGPAGDAGYNAYDHLATRYGIENALGDDRVVDNNPGAIGHHMPLRVGDCTVHGGWTMHCANGHSSRPAGRARYALAITYVDSNAEVRGDVPGVGRNLRSSSSSSQRNTKQRKQRSAFLGNEEDAASYRDWIGDVRPRVPFAHPLVPDVWPPPSTNTSSRPQKPLS